MTNNRVLWIVIGAFAFVLFVAGLIHLAFRTSAQLYFNMQQTDEKQTAHIFELERKVSEIERKQALFEQHLRYERQEEKKP